ncbi:structural protein [Pseudomonas phage PIP]|nr:structural protein [Pseudomonas phage PIP]
MQSGTANSVSVRSVLLFRCGSNGLLHQPQVWCQLSSQCPQSVFTARAVNLQGLSVSAEPNAPVRDHASACVVVFLLPVERCPERPSVVICRHRLARIASQHPHQSSLSFRGQRSTHQLPQVWCTDGVCLYSTVFNNGRHYAPRVLLERFGSVSGQHFRTSCRMITAARSV